MSSDDDSETPNGFVLIPAGTREAHERHRMEAQDRAAAAHRLIDTLPPRPVDRAPVDPEPGPGLRDEQLLGRPGRRHTPARPRRRPHQRAHPAGGTRAGRGPAVTGGLPQWRTAAGELVFETACAAYLEDDAMVGRKLIGDALAEFGDAVVANGGSGHDWLMLAVILAELTTTADPDRYAGGGMGVAMEDRTTGDRIADPDAEVAGDESWVAALAAMRMLVAHANDDRDTFRALFQSAGDNESGVWALLLLAEMAGAAWMEKMRADLPADIQINLAARELIAEATAGAEAPETRIAATGTTYMSLPIAAEDQTPESRQVTAPHGDAVYILTPYPAGVPGARDVAVRLGHQEIGGGAIPDTGVLCGVHHDEDIEPWQAPRSTRTILNRKLRDAHRETGRHWHLVRVWQHRGTCPVAEVDAPGA